MRLIAPDITPHMFSATLYKTAQTPLGHSGIQMTMDIYTHLDNEKISTSVDKLNLYFDSQRVKTQ